MKDQHLITVDELLAARDDDSDTCEGPHLISVDELRAAGALDVPAAWRKSLGGKRVAERDLFSDLDDDESPTPEQRTRVEVESGSDASADADS